MKLIQASYPFFEANQVLSNVHLNQGFDYLEAQERLTRANLIGIGIVCGLDVQLEQTAGQTKIHLSQGCGVTSEGYLIVEPTDLQLVAWRKYSLPADLAYDPFKTGPEKDAPPYTMYELFAAGEPGTDPLHALAKLEEKAVVLFLELKKDPLRNCSPNNCDDKGAAVTATVRRLLMNITDLDKINKAAASLQENLTVGDLENALLERLNLPDLRLPRYDVPNSGPVTSNAVLAAFHAVFRTTKLVTSLGTALTAAYHAFKPLLQELYPTDPFATFGADFNFLESAPKSAEEVRFLQYFYDWFDDLINAYDEFRWHGVDLLCLCCPPDDLFPRHLMAGVLFPEKVSQPSRYRHAFLASPAGRDCEQRPKELQRLFQRLVAMVKTFTSTPPLAKPSIALDNDAQIRVTPSKLAGVPLSAKAIPYYYRQDGKPPLYQLWNAEKSRRHRANQNLSYRADEYTPAAPPFVREPLRYNLEGHNFLRIEGHLGKDYRGVLNTLLALKTRQRLPIEIIALRTGAFDESMPIDLSKEKGRFQDLETLYDTLREELLCTLCDGIKYLYDIKIDGLELAGGTPNLPLLQRCAPTYRYPANSVGAFYEERLDAIQSTPYIAVASFLRNLTRFAFGIPPVYFRHYILIYYLAKFAESLPNSLGDLDFATFGERYQDLLTLLHTLRTVAVQETSPELAEFIPQEDLIDHFDQLLSICKFNPIQATHEEYARRVRELKQKQFLSFFLQQHPGIEHKAGVPLGGTFILVYHEDPDPVDAAGATLLADSLLAEVKFARPTLNRSAFGDLLQRISIDPQLRTNADIRLLLGSFTGQLPNLNLAPPPPPQDEATKVIDATVNDLANGTVIADFFLPYLCCADQSAIQFVLPVPPLGLTVQLACTEANGVANVTLTPQGGVGPITYQLDHQPFRALTGTLVVPVGDHTVTIRDSAGAESAQQTFTVPAPLTFGEENYHDDIEADQYTVSFQIVGGTPPYKAAPGTVSDDTYQSPPVPSGDKIRVTVTDSVGCEEFQEYIHTIPLPLRLTVDLACTDAESTSATAKLTPQGGVPPFTYMLDGEGSPTSLPAKGKQIQLPVGSHTVLIRDSAGTAVTRAIQVPKPLAIGTPNFTDNLAAQTYTVNVEIMGGTPPYQVNGTVLDDNSFTSQPVHSGDTLAVTITDHAECTIAEIFTRTVEEACDLPCEGKARRCHYLFWLPKPDPERPFTSFSCGVEAFKFDYPTSNDGIDLRDAVQEILQADPGELTQHFEDIIQSWLSKINDRIAATIGTSDGLVLRFGGFIDDRVGIISVEYFECLSFEFHIVTKIEQEERSNFLDMVYTPQSTQIQNEEVTIPAFDCLQIDKCDPERPEIPLCKDVDLQPTIIARLSEDRRLTVDVKQAGADVAKVFLWAVEDGTPAFSNRKKAEFTFANNEQGRKRISLIAITEKGCVAVDVETIELGLG